MFTTLFQSLLQNLIQSFLEHIGKEEIKNLLRKELEELEYEPPVIEKVKYCEGCFYNIGNQQAHYGGCLTEEE